MQHTLIQKLGTLEGNRLFVKREDLIPLSFGGNKARKAELFFRDIQAGSFDCVVTYGSSSSNHCRIISNLCAMHGMGCYIVSPQEASGETFNRALMRMFGAKITTVPVDSVHDTIEDLLQALKAEGYAPYFIPGGGHGNLGTEAYVQCYDEICDWEKETGTFFDSIYFASGTGTTHAGLVAGQLLHGDVRRITGISIARKNPYGRDVVVESIRSYLMGRASDEAIDQAVEFLDDYVGDGYAKDNSAVRETIRDAMVYYSLPLDPTYTGKAFMGMRNTIRNRNIHNQNILFIHTGGTPLFFDALRKGDISR